MSVSGELETFFLSWNKALLSAGSLHPHGDSDRRGSGGRSRGGRARGPSHHHRFGGSSATLLLNKVISSRCTMGTSRITSVRPSWSRGKMTTFNAGLSAWKLNQRSVVNGMWTEDAAGKAGCSVSHLGAQCPAQMPTLL